MSLHAFVERNAVAFVDEGAVAGVMLRLENCVHGDVNLRALCCCVCVRIDYVAVFDDVDHVCSYVHEEAKATLFHVCCIRF
jgi:hypothetical protein